MTDQEWTASLADLDGPPEGIDDAKPGDRIELLEDGVTRGMLVIEAVYTRGTGRLPAETAP